jgi:hypothetical protein
MNPKITIGLVLVMMALAGVIYMGEAGDQGRNDTTEADSLPVLPAAYGEFDIVALDITTPEKIAHFARTGDAPNQAWQMTQPELLAPAELDQVRVNGAAVRLARLTASQVITGVTNLAQYGLDPAGLTVTLTISNGQKIVLDAGNEAPIGGNRYLRRSAAGDTVYLVSALAIDELHRLLIEPPRAP